MVGKLAIHTDQSVSRDQGFILETHFDKKYEVYDEEL